MQNLILRAAFAVLLICGLTANAEANTWKSIFVSGDDSIANFDKGRVDLAARLGQIGTVQAIHHSAAPILTRRGSPIRLATIRNIGDSFSKLDVKADEGCFVHMTSHGIKNGGFYLARDQAFLPSTSTPT